MGRDSYTVYQSVGGEIVTQFIKALGRDSYTVLHLEPYWGLSKRWGGGGGDSYTVILHLELYWGLSKRLGEIVTQFIKAMGER